jgi:tRNA threonylcarbamoyladenosine biosynthesis protein TsaE
MSQTILTHSAEETKELGEKLAREIKPGTLLCLPGDLGAGKTTFVQGFLESLGAIRPYISPTFVIMKQYDLPVPVNGIERVYHLDAYRVAAKDLSTLGFTEWLADKQGVVLLEWPEHARELIPKDAKNISFFWKSESEREIVFE